MKGINDQDGVFGHVVIKYFLESIKEDSVQGEPTNMPHPKTQGSIDHNGTIEQFIYPDYMRIHNVNACSDKVGCLEYDILEDPLEEDDDRFSLEEDFFVDTWKEEFLSLSLRIQPKQFEEESMEEDLEE